LALQSRGDAADPLGLTGHFSPVVTGKNGSIMGYIYNIWGIYGYDGKFPVME